MGTPLSDTMEKKNAVIRGTDLVKVYDKRRVVDSVSIEIHAGEIVGLLGPNGAGKTTTFKMIVGFTAPTAGRVFFNSDDITGMPIHKRARLGLAYLPQETSVFQKMTVRENLMAVLDALGTPKKDIRPRLKELAEELGIAHLQKNIAGTLSGGEMRRVEIARALMTRPTFMFLDEPFASIDPKTVEDIQSIIRTLKAKGIGVLITDHNVRETLGITDRSYMLIDGRVLVSGSVKDVIANEDIRTKYLTDSIVADLAKH